MSIDEHKKFLKEIEDLVIENDRFIKELKDDLNHIKNNNFLYALCYDIRKIELFFINIYKKLKEKL